MKCPTRDELMEFALGNLPDEAIESVTDHLEACSDCESTVSELEAQSDTFIGHLREPAEPSPHAGEAEFEQALAAIKQIGRVPRSDDRTELAVEVAQLRDYRLLAKLGEGGMGTVYKALHTKLQRIVALKILPEHRSDPSSVSRFEREIAAVAKLNHPNIVSAYDAGEDEGMHYLVMELVEGIDLNRLVKNVGPLPIADACEIARQTALGLQHAHEHGLVHRDIKPSNLMLTRVESQGSRVESKNSLDPSPSTLDSRASVKILDLGLALRQNDALRHENLTNTGQVMGTLDYMAPEQANDSHNVDIRADVYSLGCTLYKLLTGEAPFGGDDFQTPVKKIMAHANSAPVSVQKKRNDVPDGLASLVDRMLDKNPGDRPTSPAQVAAALETFATGSDLQNLAAQVDDVSAHDDRIASAAEIPVMLSTSGGDGHDTIRRKMIDADEPQRMRPAHYIWAGAFAAGLACMFVMITIAEMSLAFEAVSGTMNPAQSLAREISDSLQYVAFSIPVAILSIIFFVRGYRWYRRAISAKDMPIERLPQYFVPGFWKVTAVIGGFILIGLFMAWMMPNHRSYLVVETEEEAKVEITRDDRVVKVVTMNNYDSVQLKPGKYKIRLLDDNGQRVLDKSQFNLGVDKEIVIRIRGAAEWISKEPVVLQTVDKDGPLVYGSQPLDIVWQGSSPTLVTMGIKDGKDSTTIWRESKDRKSWIDVRSVDGMTTAYAIALKDGIGLIGIKDRTDEVQSDADEPDEEAADPPMTYQFVRIADGRTNEPVVVHSSPGWGRVGGIHSDGDLVLVFLIHGDLGHTSKLLLLQSTDGGRTWPAEPKTLHESAVMMHALRLTHQSDTGELTCIVFNERRQPECHHGTDQGKN